MNDNNTCDPHFIHVDARDDIDLHRFTKLCFGISVYR